MQSCSEIFSKPVDFMWTTEKKISIFSHELNNEHVRYLNSPELSDICIVKILNLLYHTLMYSLLILLFSIYPFKRLSLLATVICYRVKFFRANQSGNNPIAKILCYLSVFLIQRVVIQILTVE